MSHFPLSAFSSLPDAGDASWLFSFSQSLKSFTLSAFTLCLFLFRCVAEVWAQCLFLLVVFVWSPYVNFKLRHGEVTVCPPCVKNFDYEHAFQWRSTSNISAYQKWMLSTMDNMQSARNSIQVCTWFFWKRYDTDLTWTFRHQIICHPFRTIMIAWTSSLYVFFLEAVWYWFHPVFQTPNYM